MNTATSPGSRFTLGLILFFLVTLRASGQAAGSGSPETNSSGTSPTPLSLPAFAALGSSFAQTNQLGDLGWTDEQKTAFLEGVNAALRGKGYAMDDAARQLSAEMARRLHELETRRKQQATEEFAKPGRLAQYMKEMRKRHGLQLSDSGLAYSIQAGRAGARPRLGDMVVVSCQATAADGTTKLPQLSNDHVRVKMDNLLPGFMEGLQMMTMESQGRFLMVPSLTFGEGDWPAGVDRGTPLLFLLTLHEIVSEETPR